MGGSVAAARLSPGGLAIYLGSRLLLAAAHLVNPGADISCWPAPRSATDASIAVLQTSPAPAHSERRDQFSLRLGRRFAACRTTQGVWINLPKSSLKFGLFCRHFTEYLSHNGFVQSP